MSDVHPSICRYCPAHCPVLVTIEEGRVVRVVGDPENELFGGYTCPKGRALPEQHNHADRLLHSVKRDTSGGYDRISPELAMDEVAKKVQQLLDQHGPRSVAMYVGTNALPYPASPALANAWLRAIGSPMFFTSNTIDQPGKQIAAALHGGWRAGEHDFESSKVWMLVGLNPLISKSTGIPSQNPGRQLTDALDRGLQLIVIDPRRTETAERATLHLQPRPGEDPSLLAGMLNLIVKERLYDHEFVETNTHGFEALSNAVAPYTPEYVAERADVPREQLIEAARLFARGPRGCSTTGTGPSFATRGTLSEYLSLALNTVCGRWRKAGEPAGRLNVLLPAYTPKAQPYAPYKAWGYGEKIRVRGLTNATSGMPTAALADEILLEGDGQVKALICIGGNPMMAWPDQRKTQRALERLELLVTLDIEMSATARLAHYVIAPKLTLETPGMTQPVEALKYFSIGIGFQQPYAQYASRLVEPPEGSELIEEWEFFYGLGQRMGLELQPVAFFGWGRHIESQPSLLPLDMKTPPTTEEIYEMICERSRVPLSEVKKHPHGRIFHEIEGVVAPRDPDCDDRLELGHATMLEELREIRAEDLQSRFHTPDYPFRLIPRRANEFLNSSGRTIDKLSRKRTYNPAYMHPEDLAALGLASGDTIEIRSSSDVIVGIAEAEPTLRRGLVSITHAFGANPNEQAGTREVGSNTGRLVQTDVDFEPYSGMPRLGALPVAISSCRGKRSDAIRLARRAASC